MTEKPILFSGPMVRAILEGRKTVTRRIVKPQPSEHMDGFSGVSHNVRGPLWRSGLPGNERCPYGKPGTWLWVRETFCAVDDSTFDVNGKPWVDYRATPRESAEQPAGWHHAPDDPEALKWKPSIHMPRWASRIDLEISGVRVERLQDITEEDAKAEGAEPWKFNALQSMTSGEMGADCPYRGGFACLWDEINEDRATWHSNPWVWRVEFRKLEAHHE